MLCILSNVNVYKLYRVSLNIIISAAGGGGGGGDGGSSSSSSSSSTVACDAHENARVYSEF